jgi:hypothetical protein
MSQHLSRLGASVIFLLIAPLTFDAATVTGPTAIRIPASEHKGSVILSMRSDSAEKLVLSAGELVDKATKEALPGAVMIEPRSLEVIPGQTYDIKVTASNIFFEGEVNVDLFNHGEKIGSLVVARAPFAVNLADTQISFRRGQMTAITLRNDARYPYDVRWMMQMGARAFCGEGKTDCDKTNNWLSARIPPKDSASIAFNPPADWFVWTEVFSRETKEATLWLAIGDDLPKRAITVKANMEGKYYLGSFLRTLTLLAMGALFSLIVRHWVPNMHRKRELKERIRGIRQTINGFSPDIEADLRAMTWAQSNLLDQMRKSTKTFLPEYATLAAQCAQGIDMLERRVNLIEEIDSICEEQRVKWDGSPPPSQIDQAEDLLRSAMEGLRKAQISEAEFMTIKDQVDRAKTVTRLMGTPDEKFRMELVSQLGYLRKELSLYDGTKAHNDLSETLRGLSLSVNGVADPGMAAEDSVTPLQQNLLDYNLRALEICRDYIWLYEGTKETEAQGILEKDVKPKLLQSLARKSWNELRLARLLLKQFREKSYEPNIWETIQDRANGMFIAYEPAQIHYQQLVQFRVCFRKESLNWSGARELIVPVWDFGDGVEYRGWTISHFFTDPRGKWKKIFDWAKQIGREPQKWEKKIKISFERTTDAALEEGALTPPVSVQSAASDDRNTRTFNEIIALLVSISIPLISLVAGAVEKEALTVFLLGFSSDAIISVFRQQAVTSS